jgi:hypothetical protein
VGLAEWLRGQTMKDVLAHADAAMYVNKEHLALPDQEFWPDS